MSSAADPKFTSLTECRDGSKCPYIGFDIHRKSQHHSISEINKLTKSDVTKEAGNTYAFLKHIDEKIKGINPNDIERFISETITGTFNKHNKLTNQLVVGSFPSRGTRSNFFLPSKNSFYFLFLANVYCNYETYLREFPWLGEKFLFICDQVGLTGIFAIDKHLYKKLFEGCGKSNHGGYEITDGYFLLSNSSIRLGTLSIGHGIDRATNIRR
jgi:hypothetical protein